MKSLNKKKPLQLLLVSTVTVITACSNWPAIKKDSDCIFVIETTYSPPVVSNLDYSMIIGSRNQVIVNPAYQHSLSLKSGFKSLSGHNNVTLPSTPAKQGEIPSNIVHFPFDSTNLSTNEKLKLDRFLAFNAGNGLLHIKIAGHTDSYGSVAYNRRLSLQRAAAVQRYLIANGVKPSLISTVGLGEQEPAATNSTDEGRAYNRRSELYPITKK